jgi:bifunctional non-homologous end joining protein LigD
LEGKDLRKEPLSARRKLLAQVLKKAPENIRLSDQLRSSKEELLRVAQEFGLEGLVAKKPNSVYERGRRSGAWVKYKITKAQEFVIGGYKEGGSTSDPCPELETSGHHYSGSQRQA